MHLKADQKNTAQHFVIFTDWILQICKVITLQPCVLVHTCDMSVSAHFQKKYEWNRVHICVRVHELAFTVKAHYVIDGKMRQKVFKTKAECSVKNTLNLLILRKQY